MCEKENCQNSLQLRHFFGSVFDGSVMMQMPKIQKKKTQQEKNETKWKNRRWRWRHATRQFNMQRLYNAARNKWNWHRRTVQMLMQIMNAHCFFIATTCLSFYFSLKSNHRSHKLATSPPKKKLSAHGIDIRRFVVRCYYS